MVHEFDSPIIHTMMHGNVLAEQWNAKVRGNVLNYKIFLQTGTAHV